MNQSGLSNPDRQRLVRLAYRFLWNTQDAEDAVQDAMVVAQQKGGQLRSSEKWGPWIRRVVVNRCISMRRHETQRPSRERDASDHRQAREASDSNEAKFGESAEMVRRALERLTPQQKVAVTLRYLEEMSFEEIATVMEVAPVTVRVHVRAGREAMRKAIEKEKTRSDARSKRGGAVKT